MNSRFDPRLMDAAIRNDTMCFLWKVVCTVDLLQQPSPPIGIMRRSWRPLMQPSTASTRGE